MFQNFGAVDFELPVEDFVFSAGWGFLFRAVAGYAIKKVMKIVVVVVGLLVAALAYLSYKGFIDVKWIAMENTTRSTLTRVAGQAVHALKQYNDTICSTSICNSSIRATSGLYVWIHSRSYVRI